jgi:hypothetical protein
VESPTDARESGSLTKTRKTVSSTNTRETVVTLAVGESERSNMAWLLRNEGQSIALMIKVGADFR